MTHITESEKINSSSWHLDKRIPITLVIMILGQTGAAFWWASNMNARMVHLEDDSKAYVTVTECMDKHMILEEKVRSVEVLNSKVADRLKDIDHKLDRLIESTFFNIRSNGN